MVARSGERQGCEDDPLRSVSSWRGHGDSGLPLLSSDAEGSDRGADLRPLGEFVEALAPLRDDDGRERAASDKRAASEDAVAGNGGRLRGGDVGNGADGKRCRTNDISPTETADSTKLSLLSDGHRQEVGQAVAGASEAWLRDGDGVLAGKLERAAEQSLDWCSEVLAIPTPSTADENLGVVARAKGVAAQTVLHTLLRVGDQQLKRAALGKLPELLRRIREEEAKLKTILPDPNS